MTVAQQRLLFSGRHQESNGTLMEALHLQLIAVGHDSRAGNCLESQTCAAGISRGISLCAEANSFFLNLICFVLPELPSS